MDSDSFSSQIKSIFRRAADLIKQSSLQQPELSKDFADLQTTLEELSLAQAELDRQQQALVETREALKVERQRYQDLFELAPDAYLVTSPAGMIQAANQAAAVLLNLPSTDLVDKSLASFLSPTAQADFEANLIKLQQGDPIPGWEVPLHPWQGTCFNAALTVKVSREAGEVTELRWQVRDITPHKQLEEHLRQSQQRLQLVMDNIPQFIFWKDRNLVYQGCNRNFAHAASLSSPGEIVGKTDYDLPWKQEEAEYFRQCDRRAMTTDTPEYHIVEPQLRANGQQTWIETNKVPLHNTAAEVIGILGTYEDVTEHQRTQELLRLQERAMAASSEGIIITDANQPDNPVTYCNPALEKISGYSEAEILGHNCQFLQGPDTDPEAQAQIRLALQQGQACQVVLKNHRRDGTAFWNEVKISPVRDDNDRLTHFISIQTDITDRIQAEAQLRQSEERYRIISQLTSDFTYAASLSANDEWCLDWVSEAFFRITGYTLADIEAPTGWRGIIHPEDLPLVGQYYQALIAGQASEIELRIVAKDGRNLWVHSYARPQWDTEQQRVVRMLGAAQDITDRKQAEEQLQHNAFHDPLTGLPNRALFMDRLAQTVKSASRYENYLFAVLFLDLDGFKLINDSLGHILGDQLLLLIAYELESCLRPSDTVARLGGDEFTILLEGINDLGDAIQIAERIQAKLTQPFTLGQQTVFISASLGIALGSTADDTPEDLLRNADIAMYRAKVQGKAHYQIFSTQMHAQTISRLQLETDLRRAIDQQELQLHYQPIVCLETGAVKAFEALVRWQHPERGLLLPREFIPVAEETGLIIPLGKWVLQEACRQAQRWQADSSPPPSISVNLSSRQFLQPNFSDQINQILQQTGLPTSRLQLEITESTIMENADLAAKMILQLRAIGIQLQIDDFGTGYSSLSYLHRFSVNALKIDHSFISRIGVDQESEEIVRTIIKLAQTLNLSVTAEGIETVAQLTQLRTLQCQDGQGYFFSKPLESQAVEAFIAQAQDYAKQVS